MAKKTWAELEMERLDKKDRSEWNEDDWDAFNYIENCWAERYREEDREANEEWLREVYGEGW